MKQNFDRYWYTDIREMVTLKDMLAGSARLYAKNPAFWVKEKKGAPYKAIDYTLLQHDVNALGTKLAAMGLSGSRIAIMGQGCYEWICTYLAAINGIGIVVPIDKELTAGEIDNLLRAADCDTIFCTKNECKKLAGMENIRRLIVMDIYGDRTDITVRPEATTDLEKFRTYAGDGAEIYDWRALLAEGEELLAGGDQRYISVEIDPDALAVILFTSGTTGNPKGVMLCHRNITVNIMDVCRIAYILESDKTLSILPIHHTYECTLGMLLVLYRGASTAFCEGFKYISQNMKEAQNTVIIVVPRVLEMIYGRIQKGVQKEGKEKLFNRALAVNHKLRQLGINGMGKKLFGAVYKELGGNLRLVITGAAALSPTIIRAFEDFGITVLQGYGMTECTPLISGTPMSAPRERYKKAGSVGTTVMTGEIELINQDESGIGEVLFRGPNVTMGYYNMPEATEELFEEGGWMHTGDLGFVDHEGWLYLTGRSKNIIVTKTGENVYPEEMEEVINRDPFVTECMVFPYMKDGEEIVGVQVLPDKAAVEEHLGHTPTDSEIKSLIREKIKEYNEGFAVYKRIRAVFVRKEDFVRTTTLKIKRQENMDVSSLEN